MPLFRRSWLRFGTRSLLALMLVVALLLLAWSPLRAQRRAVAAIERAGGSLDWDYEHPVEAWQGLDRLSYARYEGTPTGPPWVRSLLGDDTFANVEHVYLHDFRMLDNIVVSSTHDEILALLPPLTQTKTVHARTSDAGIAYLAKIPSLEELYLCGTFTEAGVAQLHALPNLKRLALSSPWLGPETLDTLCRFQGLQLLHVTGFGYAHADEQRMRMTLPKWCKVFVRSHSPWRYQSDSGAAMIWPPPPDWLAKGQQRD